jgi:hypothetical protein
LIISKSSVVNNGHPLFWALPGVYTHSSSFNGKGGLVLSELLNVVLKLKNVVFEKPLKKTFPK